jgi:hypothetical protein
MFYAKVIIGRSIEMAHDNDSSRLAMPPLVPGGHPNERYDSVTGKNIGGSDIFMVYSNKKAYPEYLITYKKGF